MPAGSKIGSIGKSDCTRAYPGSGNGRMYVYRRLFFIEGHGLHLDVIYPGRGYRYCCGLYTGHEFLARESECKFTVDVHKHLVFVGTHGIACKRY